MWFFLNVGVSNKKEFEMKKLLVLVAAILVSAGMCMAQGFFAGAHGGYTIGGDVEESGFGFGAQAGMELNDAVSIELAWTMFSEEQEEAGMKVEADANVIAATARYAVPMSDMLSVYGGGGVNYLMMDATASLSLTSEQRSELDALAQMYGISVDDLLAMSGISTASIELDLDSTIGFHICGGVNALVTESVQVFGEYRYSFGSIEGEGIDEDYNYGILRVGGNFFF